MTEDELEKLEKLANAATHGEWYSDWTLCKPDEEPIGWTVFIRDMEGGDDQELSDLDRADDFHFIAAAREAVPKLIEMVRAQRKLLKEITGCQGCHVCKPEAKREVT